MVKGVRTLNIVHEKMFLTLQTCAKAERNVVTCQPFGNAFIILENGVDFC